MATIILLDNLNMQFYIGPTVCVILIDTLNCIVVILNPVSQY